MTTERDLKIAEAVRDKCVSLARSCYSSSSECGTTGAGPIRHKRQMHQLRCQVRRRVPRRVS